MKLCLLLFILLASCTGNHTARYSVDINELKALEDNFYHYHRGTVIVYKDNNIMIWYNIDDKGDITNIWKITDTEAAKENTTAQVIEKYALDTIKEKAAAVRFTRLSHKYRFGHIKVDKNNKIAYSTNEDILEEYVYPLNDSVTHHYQKDATFADQKNGWFAHKNKRT